MGFYREQVLPRVQDVAMRREPMNDARARACSGLRGDVVEVGFGTGLNVRYYSPDVSKVLAVEPSSLCMRLAEPRIARGHTAVELAGLTGQQIDLPTDSADAVLSTWTLCTIPDVDAALSELRRVLKDGGSFHFVEHGHAPDDHVARWQRRIEPLWKLVAGGCHVTRRIPALIERAGFAIEELDEYYLDGEPKVFGSTYLGRARKH